MVCSGSGVGCDRDDEHDAPATGRGHLLGEEQSEAAQAAGDDVGAVVAGTPEPAAGGTTTLVLPVRGTSSTSLPVCSAPPIARIAVAASASG